jgi:hypothetical protein
VQRGREFRAYRQMRHRETKQRGQRPVRCQRSGGASEECEEQSFRKQLSQGHPRVHIRGPPLTRGFLLAGDTLERHVKFAIRSEIFQLNRIAADGPMVLDRIAVDSRFERNLVPVHFPLAD